MQAKPRLLIELECFVNEELTCLDAQDDDSFSQTRLQVFRECFKMFADKFKTYKPLITRIINEYENAVTYYSGQANELGYLRSKLSTLEQEYIHVKEEMKAKWKLDTDKLKKEIAELQELNKQHCQVQARMKAEIKVLKESVSELTENLEERDRRNKILLNSINSLESANGSGDSHLDLMKKLEEEQKKVKKVSMELQSALEDLTKWKQKCAELQDNPADPEMIKNFEKAQTELKKRNQLFYGLKTKQAILVCGTPSFFFSCCFRIWLTIFFSNSFSSYSLTYSDRSVQCREGKIRQAC